jgi:hypothetical protein
MFGPHHHLEQMKIKTLGERNWSVSDQWSMITKQSWLGGSWVILYHSVQLQRNFPESFRSPHVRMNHYQQNTLRRTATGTFETKHQTQPTETENVKIMYPIQYLVLDL